MVLGAGGARGLAHVHVLKALDDLGVRPKIIAGTSIGSVIGAAFCAGMSGAEIEAYIVERFNDRSRLIRDVLKIRPSSFKDFLNDGGMRLGELNLESIFSVFLPAEVPATFEELSIPLQVVATDFYASTDIVFSTGNLRTPLAASAAMPAVFLPVNIEGRFYIDGSSTNPCPLNTVQRLADHILAIDVSGGPDGASNDRPSKIDALYASSQIMQKTIAKLMAEKYPKSVLICPPVESYRSLGFLNSTQIISETAPLQEEVKIALGEMFEVKCS